MSVVWGKEWRPVVLSWEKAEIPENTWVYISICSRFGVAQTLNPWGKRQG
jgi:hypothetical protein